MEAGSLIQTLGNLGEFLGSIAVFVTLAYLTVQVRHARKATVADTLSTFQSSGLAATDQIISHSELIARADAQEELRPHERDAFEALVRGQNQFHFLAYRRARQLAHAPPTIHVFYWASFLIAHPAARVYWNSYEALVASRLSANGWAFESDWSDAVGRCLAVLDETATTAPGTQM